MANNHLCRASGNETHGKQKRTVQITVALRCSKDAQQRQSLPCNFNKTHDKQVSHAYHVTLRGHNLLGGNGQRMVVNF
jgi:hypothetical protein